MKNSDNILEHLPPIIPDSYFTLWVVFNSNILVIEPTAPFFSSLAPIYTFDILDCIIAPAHIVHGSSVTYISHPSSLQLFSFLHAFSIHIISACARLLFFFSLKLYDFEITIPSFIIIAPTGTSNLLYAFFASLYANSI
ncbi:hypothetical protein D3C76_1155910 [compost metagenome]